MDKLGTKNNLMATPEETLKKLLTKIAKEHNYAEDGIQLKAISSEGANYTTVLFLATIIDPTKPDLNLFAKVANLNEEVRSQNTMMIKAYEIEVLFYTELTANFDRIYDKNKVPVEDRLHISKHYGHITIEYEETLVLENLEASGYFSFDRMKTYDWEYAAKAVQQLARFHALGLAFKEESPSEFEKVANIIDVDLLTDNPMMAAFMAQSIKNACEGVNDEYKQRLQKYFSSMEVMMDFKKRLSQNKILIVHGDFRPSNLMHRRRNGKIEIIPVDYQTLRLGSPVGDLIYFIFSGSDEQFRRLHYERLLDHYYLELTLALQKLHIDVEKVYSRKKYDEDLEEARPIGLILGMIITPVVTVAPDDAPKMEGNIVENFDVKPNELARERLNGIVRDFIRWGVL